MINKFKSVNLSITAAEYAVVAKEVNESRYVFGLTAAKTADGKISVSVCGMEDELATLSLPTANAAPVVDTEDNEEVEEAETSISISDIKNVAVAGTVGVSKIAFKTVAGAAEVAGTAATTAALAGSNTAVRAAKNVVTSVSEDKEWAEAKANATAAYTLGKKYGKKAFGWLGKAIKDAAN